MAMGNVMAMVTLLYRCDPPNDAAAMCKRCKQPAAPVPGRLVLHGACFIIVPVAGSEGLAPLKGGGLVLCGTVVYKEVMFQLQDGSVELILPKALN